MDVVVIPPGNGGPVGGTFTFTVVWSATGSAARAPTCPDKHGDPLVWGDG